MSHLLVIMMTLSSICVIGNACHGHFKLLIAFVIFLLVQRFNKPGRLY